MISQPILAIDTSCDETSVAVTCGTHVLSNVVASQAQLHQQYGGVFPTVAKQAHLENIEPTVKAALQRAGLDWSKLGAIAVTQGPGLAPALEIGITYAMQLGQAHSLPVIPVNHIEGHVLSVLAQPVPRGQNWSELPTSINQTELVLPALAMVISGGHSDFILVTDFSESDGFSYTRIGWTIDDAAGEALDKVGRMLDLGYPAGPVIETFAKKGNPKRFEFPLPMTTSGDYNLSFSGLKTAGRNLIARLEADNQLDNQTLYDLAASFQSGVFRHINHKLAKILKDNSDIKEVWLGGGVAANATLRRSIRATLQKTDNNLTKKGQAARKLKLKTPYTKKLCGDNGAMIGVAAIGKTASKQFERKPRLSFSLTHV